MSQTLSSPRSASPGDWITFPRQLWSHRQVRLSIVICYSLLRGNRKVFKPKLQETHHAQILSIFYSIRLLVEQSQQRASTMLRQRTLLGAVFSAVFQLMFAFFISSSIDLLQVLAGLPTFLLPCGFYFKACLVVSVTGFRSVCPIQAHFRLAITVGMCSCPVLLQSSFFVAYSGQ